MASRRTSYTIAEDAALLRYVESHTSYRLGNAIYKIYAESTYMAIVEIQVCAYLAVLFRTSKSLSSTAWNTPSTSTGTSTSASTSTSISICTRSFRDHTYRVPESSTQVEHDPVYASSKPRNRKEHILPPEAQELEFRKEHLLQTPARSEEARAAKRRRLNRTAEIPSTPKEMLGTPSSYTPTGSKFRQQKQDEEEEEEDMSKNEEVPDY
ncbi:hypothetical protein E4U32_005923 [Claviceps aff. humidiphila group G2b]|nr:hypothetical protein E4U32_005923 [Claviceps aff. humidiphila group G2b]